MTLLELLPNLFYSFISLILNFIALLLQPIDKIISSLLPDLSNIFTLIGNLLEIIFSQTGWVISFLALPHTAVNLIVTYLIISVIASYSVYFIKLAIKWYNNLKT